MGKGRYWESQDMSVEPGMLGMAHEETSRQTREAREESELAGGVREAAGLRSE